MFYVLRDLTCILYQFFFYVKQTCESPDLAESVYVFPLVGSCAIHALHQNMCALSYLPVPGSGFGCVFPYS